MAPPAIRARAERGLRVAIPFAFGLLIAFGCLLRFWKLAGVGLWYDELWTVVGASSRSFVDLYRDWMLGDSHPPGFFLFYFAWLRIVPATEFWARLPSAVAGVLTVGYLLWGTARVLTRDERLVSATLASLSYVYVFYALSVKQYSALLLFTTIATVQYLEIVTARQVTRRNTIVLGLTVVALAYVNYFGLVYVAILVALLLRAMWTVAAARRRLAQLVAVSLILSAPVAPFLYLQIKYNIDGWQPYQVPTFLANIEPYLFFDDRTFLRSGFVVLALALVARLCLDAKARGLLPTRRNGHLLLLVTAFGAFMLTLGAFEPIFYVRYFLAMAPAVLLGLAIVTAAAFPIDQPWAALALLVFFGHAAATQMRSIDALQREQWDTSVDYVLNSRGPADAVYVLGANGDKTEFDYLREGDVDSVFNVRNLTFYRYYFERRGAPAIAAGLRVALPTVASARELARRFHASGATIFVLAAHHVQYPREALTALRQDARRVEVTTLNSTIVYKLVF
ncbi:MAG TPA: glycosyltransferase family 39 protein [Vicinamibacterales bacterium]|nr:glycosyltransferase family 39 protein [Vicinamibacterales bacterium]